MWAFYGSVSRLGLCMSLMFPLCSPRLPRCGEYHHLLRLNFCTHPSSPLGGSQFPPSATLRPASCDSHRTPGSLVGVGVRRAAGLSPWTLPAPAPGVPPPCTRSGHRLALQAPASEAVTPVHPQALIDWINGVLVEERIIVKQLEEDLYDGQVLQKLLGESPGGAVLELDRAVCGVIGHLSISRGPEPSAPRWHPWAFSFDWAPGPLSQAPVRVAWNTQCSLVHWDSPPSGPSQPWWGADLLSGPICSLSLPLNDPTDMCCPVQGSPHKPAEGSLFPGGASTGVGSRFALQRCAGGKGV